MYKTSSRKLNGFKVRIGLKGSRDIPKSPTQYLLHCPYCLEKFKDNEYQVHMDVHRGEDRPKTVKIIKKKEITIADSSVQKKIVTRPERLTGGKPFVTEPNSYKKRKSGLIKTTCKIEQHVSLLFVAYDDSSGRCIDCNLIVPFEKYEIHLKYCKRRIAAKLNYKSNNR